MSNTIGNAYLENDILTATPQRLHLLLIEAAIRSSLRGRELLRGAEFERACESLIHAQECVGEILGALNRDDASGLTRRIASVYLFIFRRLMEANVQRDPSLVDDALRVLEVERETWREVCARYGSAQMEQAESSPSLASPALPAAPPLMSAFDRRPVVDDAASYASGISFEA